MKDIDRIRKLAEKPLLYEKGTSVMWTDPYISKQLLALHINPEHDIASRSKDKVTLTADWILRQAGKPNMQILDLGCGPGIYAEYFARRGHSVTGVDFSQNSIQYAIEQAKLHKLDIQYLHKNYLHLDFKDQFDLVILIYLDFCALLPNERDKVLEISYRALRPGGLIIFDVVNDNHIDRKILPTSWDIENGGFWKSTPYVVLNKGYHYPEAKVLCNHHIVIGTDDTVETYIFWSHYYSANDLIPVLASKGFTDIKDHEHVLPDTDNYWNGDNVTFYMAGK